jgi:hypothetical protein
MEGLVGRESKTPPTPDPLKDGPPEKKPRKGRKSKQEKAEEAADELKRRKMDIQVRAKASAPFVAELISWPFDIIAARRGSFWKIQDAERDRLAFCLAAVLEKWLPDFMLKYGEEIALGAVFAGVVISRVREDRRVNVSVKRPRGDGSTAQREDDSAAKATDPAA